MMNEQLVTFASFVDNTCVSSFSQEIGPIRGLLFYFSAFLNTM